MEKYIKEYLLQNNKLSIANFGIFEIVYKSSEIHPILHTFTAPGKYVVFQENNNISSDEFSDFVALQEQITKEEAIVRTNQWIEEIRQTITGKKEYSLSTLGKFILNAMEKIEFIPSLDTDISPESLGLENFTAEIPSITPKEIKQEVIIERKEIEEAPIIQKVEEEKHTDSVDNCEIITDNADENEVETNEDEPKKTKKRRPVLIILITLLILAFCSMLAVGITYYFYPQTLQNNCETLYVFIQDKIIGTETQTEENDTITTENSLSEENIITTEDQYIQPELAYTENISDEEQAEIAKSPVENTPVTETPKQDVVTGNYYVVIGSFKESANAEAFLTMKKSEYSNAVNLGLGKTSQLYIIAIGPYSKTEAEQQIKNGVNGWLLKK